MPCLHLTALFAVLLCLFAAGCSGSRVTTDYQKGYDFSQVTTWGWREPRTQPAKDAELNSDLIRERIEQSIHDAMVAQGLNFVDNPKQTPNIVVHYLPSIQLKFDVRQTSTANMFITDSYYDEYYDAYYETYYPIGSGSQPVVRDYLEGKLVIDFFTTKGDQVIWRGTNEKEIEDGPQSPEEIKKEIDEIVTAIVAAYPPQTK